MTTGSPAGTSIGGMPWDADFFIIPNAVRISARTSIRANPTVSAPYAAMAFASAAPGAASPALTAATARVTTSSLPMTISSRLPRSATL